MAQCQRFGSSRRVFVGVALCSMLGALGCSKNEGDQVESPTGPTPATMPETAPATVASPEPEKPVTHEESTMSSEDMSQLIQERVAAQHGLTPDDIKVKLYDDKVDIPGVVLFTARQQSGRGGGRKFSIGVVHDGQVETNSEVAMSIAIKALGYGRERTVPPERVAHIIGLLEGTQSTPKPILSQKDLDFFKKVGRPEYSNAAFLPRETEVDGLPAVEYCNRADRPPFWIATAVFHADGTVEVRRAQVH